MGSLLWFYFKCIAIVILAMILKYANVWLGAVYAFCIVFGFGIYAVYNEYKWHRLTKENLNEIIWHLIKFFLYGILGAALLSFSGGDDPYINDYMEYLEPR